MSKKRASLLFLLTFLSVDRGSLAYSEICGQMHCLPCDNSYSYVDERAAFYAMVNQWDLNESFKVSYIKKPGNSGPLPAEGFSIDDWFSKHQDSRYIELNTHGHFKGALVEAFTDAANRNQRFLDLAAAGWDTTIDSGTYNGIYKVYYQDSDENILFHGIAASASCMSLNLPWMERDALQQPLGIALLSWCSSLDNDNVYSAYFGHGAMAVYGMHGSHYHADLVPIKEVFACQKYYQSPSYDAYVCCARDYVNAENENIDMQFNPSRSTCGDPNNLGITGKSCSKPAVDFTVVGKSEGTVYWVAREETTTTYFVCGFDQTGSNPSVIKEVAGNPMGGHNREVFYEVSVATELPYWEIIEVDDDPGTPHVYSGFITEGVRSGVIDALRQHRIKLSPEELTASVDHLKIEAPALFVNGTLMGVEDLSGGVADGVYHASEVGCGECEDIVQPDSSQCADWLVVSHDIGFCLLAGSRQAEYLNGRGMLGCTLGSSDPEAVRQCVRGVWCANKQWNAWATSNGHPRRFNEQFLLTIVGSPGIMNTHGALTNVGLAYDINDNGNINDGMLAMPWENACDDSIVVPYTRIPARNADDIDRAYDVAQAYSAGLDVDPLGQVVQIAGDINRNLVCAEEPQLMGAAQFVERWTGLLAQPVKPLVRRSDPCDDRRDEILDQVNDGLALFASWSHLTDKHQWSVTWSLNELADYSTKQVFVGIVPSCRTANMIGDEWPHLDPLAYRLINNDQDKTRLAFLNGWTGNMNYAHGELWGMHLLSSMDAHSEDVITWQEVVYEAQMDLAAEIGDWAVVQAIGNVGAPLLMPQRLTVSVGSGALEPTRLSARVWPNPTRTGSFTGVEFYMPHDGDVEIGVFDVGGRLVRGLKNDWYDSGRHLVTWDGVTDQGRRVAKGVYFIRVATADETAVKRVVRLE